MRTTTPFIECCVAGTGVFVGSLLWAVFFGDGIQSDDLGQAMTLALIAASIQGAMSTRSRR